MGYENILYVKKEGIAHITFNRPKVLNALNRKTVEELREALLDARDDEAVRVLILTGAGEKSFVAGADIGELALQTPVNGKEFSLYGQSVFHLLETMGKPSICAINGFALGGGCELALSCSIRIASKTAKLGQPEVKLGILPGYGGAQRVRPRPGQRGGDGHLLFGGTIPTRGNTPTLPVLHTYHHARRGFTPPQTART